MVLLQKLWLSLLDWVQGTVVPRSEIDGLAY